MPTLSTKVVGVSFGGRQENLLYLRSKPLIKVFIVPEPENKFDKNAIRVETEEGRQLGYIGKYTAETLSKKITKKQQVSYKIYGGGLGKNYGMEITIWL